MKILLLAAGLVLLARGGVASPVSVTPISYHGWTDAYRLSNGLVEVVVVPSIGRVMDFSLNGHPDTDPIFNSAEEYGKPAPPARPFPKAWINYGGDKLWPSPQSDWPKHQPTAWPPDPSFDSGPYRVARIPGGIRLTGPVSPYYQIRVVRDITLPPHGAEVRFRNTFIKSSNARGTRNGFLVGVWNVTQTRGDETVFLPVTRQGNFPALGYLSFRKAFPGQPTPQPQGNLLEITRNRTLSTKVGSDSPAGWVASLYDGETVFSEHFTRVPGVLYPDQGCSAEVYTNPGTEFPYIEMEVLGPMTHLRAGQRIVRVTSWRLQHLPRIPRNDADARHLVSAAMASDRSPR